MEVKFDVVQPNLLVTGNEVYTCVSREDVLKYARDVDDVVGRNIGTLHVRESDVGVMADDPEKRKSKEFVPLSEYLSACEQKSQEDFRGLTKASYKLLGAGDYVVNTWTLEKDVDVNHDEISQTRGFLRNLGKHIKYIGECFGTAIDEESAKKHLEERLDKLEKGLAERFAHLWVVLGQAPSKHLKHFYDDRIAVGRVILGSRQEGDDETLTKTREELVEKLKSYKGDRLSFDVSSLMNQVYMVHLDGDFLMAKYGDVLDNPEWRRHLTMLDA